MRPTAYMKAVVMQYLDTLIAMADDLFSQDSVESINEATQLYSLASLILGEKPQKVPGVARRTAPLSYKLLNSPGGFYNPFQTVDANVPAPTQDQTDLLNSDVPVAGGALLNVGITRYFCFPSNDKLLSYWDTIADRFYVCFTAALVFRLFILTPPPFLSNRKYTMG